MHTLVQDGITPLTEVEMQRLVDVVDGFLSVGDQVRFEALTEDVITHALRPGWLSICSRVPTRLEIMAACCTLESQGHLRFDFIEGLMHVASVPCGRSE
jgi:hypothetical protein